MKPKTLNHFIVLEEQVKQISTQSEQLEDTYGNITASITYAKRIQESILIEPQTISEYFEQSFVFYQPKDIVSGDFYWFSAIESELIITAIDCTGHGVPGAFMTMMANSMLNEIVNEKKETNPANILLALNEKIRETLNQEQQEMAQDGMDMALVKISPVNKEVTFAGANKSNVLYC
ncbi:MAG: SpoIIE family protein phosphatase [Cytophagales bacterium]|nr:SpoIIE family protein phosphatase [Cytophagales bacterium]